MYDSIEQYLKEPLVAREAISAGYIKYWTAQAGRPQVGKMALDFISAPGELMFSLSILL